jgi:hypothetical protein
MRQHRIATDGVVSLSDREGVSGTTRGQRLEAQVCQQSSATDIPWVRNNERAGALVKLAESKALLSLGQHAISSFLRWQCEGPFNYLYKVSLFTKNDTFALR